MQRRPRTAPTARRAAARDAASLDFRLMFERAAYGGSGVVDLFRRFARSKLRRLDLSPERIRLFERDASALLGRGQFRAQREQLGAPTERAGARGRAGKPDR